MEEERLPHTFYIVMKECLAIWENFRGTFEIVKKILTVWSQIV